MTVSRPSTIDRLPPEVRDALNGWLRDPGITQTEATERVNLLLDEFGAPPISRHAVNRYDLRMRSVGQKLRESRQVAEVWIAKLGSEPGGRLGHLVTELIRSLAFDLSLKLQEGELTEESLPGVVSLVNKLALTAQRVERASDISQNREAKIRQSEREKAADIATRSLSRQKGLSPDTIETIKRDILGIS